MTRTLFVPCDSAARALGSDAVAAVFGREITRRGLDLRIVRNGSRGMVWLEPLAEIETDRGRIGFGPVAPEDVPSVLNAMLDGGEHPLAVGRPEAQPSSRASSVSPSSVAASSIRFRSTTTALMAAWPGWRKRSP